MRFQKNDKIITKIGGMTCQFGLGCKFISTVKEGDLVDLTVVGKYSDAQVECWIVSLDGITHQENGTLLHITTRNDGVSPIESGIRATKHGYQEIKPFVMYAQKAHYILAD